MARFYTQTGDDGYTSQLGEGRLPKYHPRTEAVGAVDEATAALGVARAASQTEETRSLLLAVQRDLYNLMAEIAATPENAPRFRLIDAPRVAWLESQIDGLSARVEVPGEFIVPGDSPAGAALDMARTVVRRAERRVAHLIHKNEIENTQLLRYLNRLSSLCFVLELLENKTGGVDKPTLAKG
jgi:cob(I)alamin adenosyltransferase